eukprot:SAG25_NODE_1834_length_2279_cov_11.904587_2_plen_193_part_00
MECRPHPHALSLSHTHSLSLFLALSHSLTLSLSLSLALSHTLTRSLFLSLSHTHSLALSLSLCRQERRAANGVRHSVVVAPRRPRARHRTCAEPLPYWGAVAGAWQARRLNHTPFVTHQRSRRGGCQTRWHSLVSYAHGDSTTSRLDAPPHEGVAPAQGERRPRRPGTVQILRQTAVLLRCCGWYLVSTASQ